MPHNLLLLALAVAGGADEFPVQEIQHTSHAGEKVFTFSLTGKQLAASPSWERDADNPPLSAREAIRRADKLRESLVKDWKSWKWKFVSADLCHVAGEKWYWMIRYEMYRDGPSLGSVPRLGLPVLMDGTVVEPKSTRSAP